MTTIKFSKFYDSWHPEYHAEIATHVFNRAPPFNDETKIPDNFPGVKRGWGYKLITPHSKGVSMVLVGTTVKGIRELFPEWHNQFTKEEGSHGYVIAEFPKPADISVFARAKNRLQEGGPSELMPGSVMSAAMVINGKVATLRYVQNHYMILDGDEEFIPKKIARFYAGARKKALSNAVEIAKSHGADFHILKSKIVKKADLKRELLTIAKEKNLKVDENDTHLIIRTS